MPTITTRRLIEHEQQNTAEQYNVVRQFLANTGNRRDSLLQPNLSLTTPHINFTYAASNHSRNVGSLLACLVKQKLKSWNSALVINA
jgi:hypothetical protein